MVRTNKDFVPTLSRGERAHCPQQAKVSSECDAKCEGEGSSHSDGQCEAATEAGGKCSKNVRARLMVMKENRCDASTV